MIMVMMMLMLMMLMWWNEHFGEGIMPSIIPRRRVARFDADEALRLMPLAGETSWIVFEAMGKIENSFYGNIMVDTFLD